MELNLKTFLELRKLGVTKVTMTKEAMDKFSDSVRGLYVPAIPFPPEMIEAGFRGAISGLEFYEDA